MKEMKLNHAFRHFSDEEVAYYFEYGKKYSELFSGKALNKYVMTDGKDIYLCHFDSDGNLLDSEFIAGLKYVSCHELMSR